MFIPNVSLSKVYFCSNVMIFSRNERSCTANAGDTPMRMECRVTGGDLETTVEQVVGFLYGGIVKLIIA